MHQLGIQIYGSAESCKMTEAENKQKRYVKTGVPNIDEKVKIY
jgi:hypothetical protein